MENHVEMARTLVENLRMAGRKIGELEGQYVIKYAFYAEEFDNVRKLAQELGIRGYEAEHGTLDEEFLKPYDREMEEKIEKIKEFLKVTERAETLLAEGNRLFAQMQEVLLSMGFAKSYGEYVYQKEREKKRKRDAEIQKENVQERSDSKWQR